MYKKPVLLFAGSPGEGRRTFNFFFFFFFFFFPFAPRGEWKTLKKRG
jgi:hypothetical protein